MKQISDMSQFDLLRKNGGEVRVKSKRNKENSDGKQTINARNVVWSS